MFIDNTPIFCEYIYYLDYLPSAKGLIGTIRNFWS